MHNSMETQNKCELLMYTVMIAGAKRIFILIIKVNKLFFFFSLHCFLKEIENMFSLFLSSYRNTCESLGELEKAVKKLACHLRPHSISCSPKHLCVYNSIMYSVFLSSYRSTCQSLGELKKAVETLACGSNSHSISCSSKLTLMFL